jgi:putative oxidoreductase
MRQVHHATVLPFGPVGLRSFFETAGPVTHAVLRMAAALFFMQHGAQKLFGMLGGMGGHGESAPLISLMGFAGVLELFGGLLILFGALTRPIALLLAGQMAVAYVMAHMPQGGLPIENQGELALLYSAVFLFLAGNGAGPLSIDHWLGERRARRELAVGRAPFQERRVGRGDRRRGQQAA